jgi:hypothetical protein
MAIPVRKRRQIGHYSMGYKPDGREFECLRARHCTLLNQAVAVISKATSFLIFGPFRPTTDFSDASLKPKP